PASLSGSLQLSAPAPAAAAITRSLTLGWTAPGNDGASGTAAAYSVRYGTSPLSESNWAAATALPGAPTPGPAGTAQTLAAAGFTPGATYYVAAQADDASGNRS